MKKDGDDDHIKAFAFVKHATFITYFPEFSAQLHDTSLIPHFPDEETEVQIGDMRAQVCVCVCVCVCVMCVSGSGGGWCVEWVFERGSEVPLRCG